MMSSDPQNPIPALTYSNPPQNQLVSDIEKENIKSISKQKVSKSFQMPSRRYPCIRGEEEAAPPILMSLELHLI